MKKILQKRAEWLSKTNYDHIGIGLVSLAQAIIYAVDALKSEDSDDQGN
jgi:hypothetical protein